MNQKNTERKKAIEQIFSQKSQDLQETEKYKANLINELLMIKGKLDLLDEMIKEDQNSENTPKSVTHTEKKDIE